MKPFILASNSPRRREYLSLLDIPYDVEPSDIEEIIDPGLSPGDIAEDIAYDKATDIFDKHPDRVVLGFDTLVVAGDTILGKPEDEEDVRRMLKMISGKSHRVITGCAIISRGRSRTFHTMTKVFVDALDDDEIDAYIATGEAMDKAGAYGIQGAFSKHVSAIEGDYYTVIGLPISALYKALKAMDLWG